MDGSQAATVGTTVQWVGQNSCAERVRISSFEHVAFGSISSDSARWGSSSWHGRENIKYRNSTE